MKQEYLFIVLTYQHEAYIIEHLESIKYQIERYGTGRDCALLLADDCSHDSTVILAKRWCMQHKELFTWWKILESQENHGTCANFVGTFSFMLGRRVKVVAGDDLYSSQNIFELMDGVDLEKMKSGIPLLLYPEGLSSDKAFVFNIMMSGLLYKKSFLRAMQQFSSIHTPSLAYDGSFAGLPGMAEFITGYKVVEDFAFQIRLAELLPDLEYQVIPQVYIYYRRTHQSTYMIRNSAFLEDKERLFSYLADREQNLLRKVLIRNRVYCLRLRGLMKILLNANSYVYALRIIPRIPTVLHSMRLISWSLVEYREHYSLISNRARKFLKFCATAESKYNIV